MIARVGLGEILWSLLVIYVMVMYFIIVLTVWIDIFRSDDISGGKKALWILGLLFFPIISLVAYLLTRGDGFGMRQMARETNKSQGGFVPPPPTPARSRTRPQSTPPAGRPRPPTHGPARATPRPRRATRAGRRRAPCRR